MHQSRRIPTLLEHRGNHVFLAEVRLGDVFDAHSLRGRQCLCGFTMRSRSGSAKRA